MDATAILLYSYEWSGKSEFLWRKYEIKNGICGCTTIASATELC
jgi:hypothetical protein